MKNPTILLAIALMAIIVMMVLPVPAWVLDVGLAASFGLAILIFTITLFIKRPLEFSAFPTVLLASVMLRLSLNVSSTKLIIGEGHTGTNAAGSVIEGVASFIMNGSIFLGLVVFGVLMIVNFIVISKGAARMAEVGARFALDGMPGRQMAIDSDISAGAIDHAEARKRRELEQQETTFFGSLDGASKFVKGDAIAGILITLLNIVAGLVMGVFVHGMHVGNAFETYAILTVGDGLVTQIPAVIISIASALLLARGGATESTDKTVFSQIGRYPAALRAVGILMVLFALFPGLPFLPFLLSGVLIAGASYFAAPEPRDDAKDKNETEEIEVNTPQKIGDILDLDDIHIEFAHDLVNMILDEGTGLDVRIKNMRKFIASKYGLIMPEIRMTDSDELDNGVYVIKIHGVEAASGVLHPDLVLALQGEEGIQLPAGADVAEPVYGAPARWIKVQEREKVALMGVTIVAPNEVLATHLLEVIKKNLGRLLTLKSLRRLLDELVSLTHADRANANKRLLDELIPEKVQLDTLHSVLKLLLNEEVSIRNLPLILESIAEMRGRQANVETMCEHVRQRLGFQIVASMRRKDGTIPLIQLEPEWEETFLSHQIDGGAGQADVALPPELFDRLTSGIAKEMSSASAKGVFPALIVSARRRKFLRTITAAKGITNPVLSFDEIGVESKPALVGSVTR